MTLKVPLNALRAFEAAARTGSFTAAARELGVSSPAVSQQVKHLEAFWQQALFIRQGNRLSLTDAGQSAYPHLAQAMGNLSALSDRMQSGRTRKARLVLSAPQSVAETWLAAKLAPMTGGEDYDPVDVRVDDDPVDLVQDRIDMRIFFGHDLYGDYRVDTLFADRLIACASPDFAARFGGSIRDVPDRYLIHTDWGRGFASSPDWEAALQEQRAVRRDLSMTVRSSSTALNFCRHGFGVALVPAEMAADDIAAGRVVSMDVRPVELSRNYRIAYPKRLQIHPVVLRILRALSGRRFTRSPSPSGVLPSGHLL